MVSDSAIAEMKMKALIQPGLAATQANRVLTNSECMVDGVRIGQVDADSTPSWRLLRTRSARVSSATSLKARISSANRIGRWMMMLRMSLPTLPARASNKSASSPKSAAKRRIISSDGGEVFPRSTLLR